MGAAVVAAPPGLCAVCERTAADHAGLVHEFTSGDIRIVRVRRCADCGSGGRHKTTCPRAVVCADCGSGGRHKTTCPKAAPLKHPYCRDCGGRIQTEGHRAGCAAVLARQEGS